MSLYSGNGGWQPGHRLALGILWSRERVSCWPLYPFFTPTLRAHWFITRVRRRRLREGAPRTGREPGGRARGTERRGGGSGPLGAPRGAGEGVGVGISSSLFSPNVSVPSSLCFSCRSSTPPLPAPPPAFVVPPPGFCHPTPHSARCGRHVPPGAQGSGILPEGTHSSASGLGGGEGGARGGGRG